MHSRNNNLIFKKLLINKFRVKLVEIFIIRFLHYTVFSIYSQDDTAKGKGESIAPTSEKAFLCDAVVSV